ncbi:hypothetical protein E3N88_32450 [Mikania micrantha]|uniref:Reverse transcriptase domain-containing protein n=1 Tax=Mikania micrantha TaxID=192012 RepID=A0A5N6M8K6_9ASTR|nr:hypothetical protein E3N88_32450 [Mikania micrantha]
MKEYVREERLCGVRVRLDYEDEGDTTQNTALQGNPTNTVTLVIPPSTTKAQALLANITPFASLPPQSSTSVPMGATTYPFATSFPFIMDHTFPSMPNPLPTFPPFSVSMPQPPFYTSGPKASTTIHTHVDPFHDLSQQYVPKMKMSFRLKNDGATYQRLMDMAFKNQVGRNIEVYVDDLVVKSNDKKTMLEDIEETFSTLKQINMTLNPAKCSIGSEEGKFLGHLVCMKDIRANPEKVRAIIEMLSPKTMKEVQRLNGKIASLHRFLSKSAKKSLPFFKVLKACNAKTCFQWTEEAEIAFNERKEYIANLPTLVVPKAGEKLTMFILKRLRLTAFQCRESPLKDIYRWESSMSPPPLYNITNFRRVRVWFV